ncbi:hypothetical protein PTKIN_Ptkin04bG0214000 [Pterospermum kingtungense]
MDQIHHFLHNHPLILTELVEEEEVFDQFHCSGCGESLSVPSMDAVIAIFTFINPAPSFQKRSKISFTHALFFSKVYPTPMAIYAMLVLKASCVSAMPVEGVISIPTIESEGEELIQHFTHWHPLKRLVDGIGKEKDLEVRCGICNKLCCGSSNSCACGCEECNFFVHYSCMSNIPRQINHFFHPSCPLILFAAPFSHLVLGSGCASCGKRGPGLFFGCQKCLFQLDVECALLPTIDSKDADKIQHSAHQHPLALHENMESEARCRACGENCSEAKREMDQIHHFLHTHPLILTEEKVGEIHCRGCGKGLSGPIYGCRDCDFFLLNPAPSFNFHRSCTISFTPAPLSSTLHPIDATLVSNTAMVSAIAVKALVDQKNKDLEVGCHICDKLCSGSSNSFSVYGCEECNFFLHKSCMMNTPRQINHLFHPSRPLILLTTSFDRCQGCAESGSRLVFRCGKCQNFQLDVKCALLPTVESKGADKIQHSGHQHPLALRENMEYGSEAGIPFIRYTLSPLPPDPDHDTFRCPACGGHGDRSLLLYRCTKCHLHPLTRSFSPFEFELNSPEDVYNSDDEFYCDVCEGKNSNLKQFITVKNANLLLRFAVLCPRVTLEARDEENSALEATIEKLNNEIEELRAKEKLMEVEIEKLQTALKPTKKKLEELETDRVISIYELNHKKKEDSYPTEASTS